VILNGDKRGGKNNVCPEGTSLNNSYINKLSEIAHTGLGIFKNMEVITLTER